MIKKLTLIGGITLMMCSLCSCASNKEPEINEALFPDPVLRAYVSDEFDTDGNGRLSEEEIAGAKYLEFGYKDITDLTGIHVFTAARWLGIESLGVKEIDLSFYPELRQFECYGNQLTTLDFSKNPKLLFLECSNNPLTTFDTSKNPDLATLGLPFTNLTTIDISSNTNLSLLNISGTPISELDVSNNLDLDVLSCRETELSTLDLSANLELETLDCDHTKIKELDLTQNPRVFHLVCNEDCVVKRYHNPETSITCDGEPITEEGDIIICATSFPDEIFRNFVTGAADVNKDNLLSAEEIAAIERWSFFSGDMLDLKGIEYFTALKELDCSQTDITSLNVSQNTELESLDCSMCELLTELDVSQNTKMTELDIRNSGIQRIDLTNNTALEDFYCHTTCSVTGYAEK